MKVIGRITAIVTIATICGAWVWAEEDTGPELVKAAYLGVGTRPVSETLVHHLDLPEGTGIVVEFVDPESPAAEVVQKHDVLHMLNDQILVNHQQLAALVRMHKPGEKISLTLLRKGKKMTVETELAEKEMPRLTQRPWHMPRIDFGHPRIQKWVPQLEPGRMEDMKGKVKEMLDELGVGPDKIGEMMKRLHQNPRTNGSVHIKLTPGPAGADARVNIESHSSTKSVVTTTDSRRSFTLTTTDDGHKHLAVSDHTGKVLFDGPVNTTEEIADLPANLKKGFDKVSNMARDMGSKLGTDDKDVL